MGKKDILISDTNDVPGKKIIKTIGKVKTKCNAEKSDIKKLAIFKFKEGPIKLKKIANKLGANAIIEVRFGYRGMDLVGEGTAVIVEDED